MEGTKPIAGPYRTVAAVVTWLALALQLYLTFVWHLSAGLGAADALLLFVSYFTILSNILAALVLSAPGVRGEAVHDTEQAIGFFSRPAVAGGTMVYMLLVLLAYLFVLRPIWHPHGLQSVADLLLNILTPVLFVVYWARFVPKGWLRTVHIGWWLVAPAVYLLYALLRGIRSGFYAYPFINTNRIGTAAVAVNCCVTLLIVAVLGWITVTMDRRMRTSASPVEQPAA